MKTIIIGIIIFASAIFQVKYSQQTKINFQSKKSKGITINNKRLLILWDQVIFKNNKSTMYCDSSIYDRTNNSFIAYQNIRINENDSLELFGDSLHYFGDEQTAYIFGNVKVINDDITLKTPSLVFDQKNKIAYYSNNGKIVDKKKGYTIISQKGTFKTRSNTVFFKKDVKLNHPDYNITSDTLIYNTKLLNTIIIGETKINTKNSVINCEKGWFNNENNQSSLKGHIYIESDNHTFFADSIYYNESSGISYAEGNVKIIEDSNNVIIEGSFGRHNENSDSTRIWDNAILTQVDSSDTLKIFADQFIKIDDSISDQTFCFNNVIIDGTQLQGDCDSIYFNESDSVMKCITQPIIWVDSNQVSGDKIEFKIHNGVIYKMFVEKNAMIINKKDSLHYDQIKGDVIDGFFVENKMKVMKVNGDGKVLYYSKDENDSLVAELNDITCEKMNIYLSSNKIDRINFTTNPKGETRPVNSGDSGKYLDGFYIYPKRTYLEKYKEANGDSLKGK